LTTIAKAQIVSGTAASLGRSVRLSLCKTPGQDQLAALLLLVPCERLRRRGGDSRNHAGNKRAMALRWCSRQQRSGPPGTASLSKPRIG
jgi:hypothetical protein